MQLINKRCNDTDIVLFNKIELNKLYQKIYDLLRHMDEKCWHVTKKTQNSQQLYVQLMYKRKSKTKQRKKN